MNIETLDSFLLVVSPLGGILADKYDRRSVMLALDLLSTLIALVYLLSYYIQSVPLLYFSTVLQEVVTGLYDPARSSIVPLLVPPGFVPRATTAVGMVWSSVTAMGSSLSGFIVDRFGIGVCFAVDAATYLLSAVCLLALQGSYTARDGVVSKDRCEELEEYMLGSEEEEEPSETMRTRDGENSTQSVGPLSSPPTESSLAMIQEALHYIIHSEYGLIVFCKGSGALTFGASDVLAVNFSESSARRLGIYFAAVGIGCIAGPTTLDRYWRAHGDGALSAWLLGMAWAFWPVASGYLFLSIFRIFWLKCVWNGLRALGVAILWIDSSQILQKTTPPRLLGRIIAIDLSLALLGESLSAVVAGILMDDLEYSGERVAVLLSVVAGIFATFWTCYVAQRGRVTARVDDSGEYQAVSGDTESKEDDFLPVMSNSSRTEVAGALVEMTAAASI